MDKHTFNVLSLQNQLKLYLSICLIDDGWDIPSWICDSIRAIKHVLVMFFWVKTSSTHYEGAVLLTKWLFIYVLIHKQSTYISYLSICLVISKVYRIGLAMLGSLVVCTVYTNKCTSGQLKLRLGI